MASQHPPSSPRPVAFREAVETARRLNASEDPEVSEILIALMPSIFKHAPSSADEAADMIDLILEESGERSDGLHDVALRSVSSWLRAVDRDSSEARTPD